MAQEMVLVARDSKNSSDPLYRVFVFSQQHASVLCELLKISVLEMAEFLWQVI